jgi:hypothetical protein
MEGRNMIRGCHNVPARIIMKAGDIKRGGKEKNHPPLTQGKPPVTTYCKVVESIGTRFAQAGAVLHRY